MPSPALICPSLSDMIELAETLHQGGGGNEVVEYMQLFETHRETCEACRCYFEAATKLVATRQLAVDNALTEVESMLASADSPTRS